MRKMLIPVANRSYTQKQFDQIVFELKTANAERVMIVYNRFLNNRKKQLEEKELLIKNMDRLAQNGFEVGAWIAPTVGYGADYGLDYGAPYTHLHTITDEDIPGAFCPLDKRFTEDLCNVYRDVASAGVKFILSEDDYTLSGGKTTIDRSCCACKAHMEKYREILGEDVSVDMLPDLIYKNSDKKYRRAWLSMQGEALKSLTREIEKAVHGVDKNIRLGLSSNGSSFIAEGVSLDELERIIAGNTKPFIRTTGAPYWKNNSTFASNIEASRLVNYLCGEDIELYCEGDVYPRPRHFVPAAFLEAFDTVLMAEGKTEGILKYVMDYNSSADYETGYIDIQTENAEMYRAISDMFDGGVAEGLNIFENKNTLYDNDFGKDCSLNEFFGMGAGCLPTVSQWFAADNSIPTTYGNTDCASLCFGVNAYYLTEEQLKNGVILDAVAAKILTERGIDVGIEKYESAENPSNEYFIAEDDRTMCSFEREGSFYDFTLKPGAEVQSEFRTGTRGLGVISDTDRNVKKYPACYRYENKDGQRFMVYSFSAATVTVYGNWSVGLFRNYYRQKQLADGIKWLQKRPLPAMCYKNPELYILAKKNGDRLSVGLWNMFADPILKPVIELDGEYVLEKTFNCNGHIDGKTAVLDNAVAPYGFAFFTAVKRR